MLKRKKNLKISESDVLVGSHRQDRFQRVCLPRACLWPRSPRDRTRFHIIKIPVLGKKNIQRVIRGCVDCTLMRKCSVDEVSGSSSWLHITPGVSHYLQKGQEPLKMLFILIHSN